MHYPLTVHERLSTSSDHFPFVMHGIPTGLVENEAPPASASGLVGRGWGHTIADTVDKVRPATVQSAAVVTARLLLRLAEDERWPGRQRTPAAVEGRSRRYGPPRRATPIRPLAAALVQQRRQRLTGKRLGCHDLIA